MLDFQRGPRPRNYLSRREQGRLLLLVLALGVVVILVLQARNPEPYRRLFRLFGLGQPTADSPRAAEGPPIDTRLLPEAQSGEIPGTFISPAPAQPDEETPPGYFPGVRPARLKSVRDNKPLGVSEWDAWLHLFDVLQRSDEPTLREASSGRVSFVQLFDQPAEYRGELVTTQGTIRRAHSTKTPKNEYGLTDYYQLWLSPADHPTDPMVIWCLHLPEGFPTGMEVAEEAEVTGFFFKLWAYKAGDGIRRAPMLLARTLDWRRRPPAANTSERSPWLLGLMIAGSAAFALLATAYVYYRTRRGGPAGLGPLAERFASRDAETPADMGAALAELAEPEQSPEP